MMKMSMTIGRKFALTGALLMALCVLLGGVALVSLGSLRNVVDRVANDALPGVSLCSRVESALNEMRGDMLKHIGAADPNTKKAAEANIQKLKQTISQNLSEYEREIADGENRKLFANIAPAFERYYAVCEGVLAVSREGKNDEAFQKYDNESIKTGVYRAARGAIQAETDFNRKSASRDSAAAIAAGAQARWLIWFILGVSVVSGSGLLYTIVRGMNRALAQVAAELSSGAEQVASAAAQASSSSQSLAQGSSEQAASLEETSASSEEINAMAHKNTQNSRSAVEMVTRSQEKFVTTNQALEQTVVAMGEIHTQSGKISRIIKVIDEIAFQTNILALNAAVEAARAGEAGMGFAVVADEVRNLAQRCAQAARDTTALIEESVEKSKDGKVKVDQVAAAIRTITEGFGTVKTMVDEVNVGSQEQSSGLEQIGKALTQMDLVTQNTAANAEESAAASEELTAQSETLKDIVRRLTAMVSGPGTTREQTVGRNRPRDARRSPAIGARPVQSALVLSARRASVSPPTASRNSAKSNISNAASDKNAFPMEDDEFQDF